MWMEKKNPSKLYISVKWDFDDDLSRVSALGQHHIVSEWDCGSSYSSKLVIIAFCKEKWG